mmetsp:Transcript_19193/g.44461  ORF Transcript_19193/g.44461 Transcript_19193/m.44461 type:complete len:121 (-) Transcript_19193:281-643(-)
MGIRAVAVLVDLRATGINMDRDVDRDVDMDAAAATDAAAAFIVNEFSKTKSQLQDSRRHALEWNGTERNGTQRNGTQKMVSSEPNRTKPSQANIRHNITLPVATSPNRTLLVELFKKGNE